MKSGLAIALAAICLAAPATAAPLIPCDDTYGGEPGVELPVLKRLTLEPTVICLTVEGEEIDAQIHASALEQAVQIPRVTSLKIFGDDGPLDLSPLANAGHIHTLDLFRPGASDLSPLQSMASLRVLKLSYDANAAMAQVSGLRRVRTLNVFSPKEPIDLSALAGLSQLETLLIVSGQVTGTQALVGLTALTEARFSQNKPSDFTALSGLTSLKKLMINGSAFGTILGDISFVQNLTALESLDLSFNTITDLSPLANLRKLRILNLNDNRELQDITPLSALTAMGVLRLGHTKVSDIRPLGAMTALKFLKLNAAPVEDIAVLAGMPQLQSVHLYDTKVRDAEPLRNLPLRYLGIRGSLIEDLPPLPARAKIIR